jgi:hypothetical protein
MFDGYAEGDEVHAAEEEDDSKPQAIDNKSKRQYHGSIAIPCVAPASEIPEVAGSLQDSFGFAAGIRQQNNETCNVNVNYATCFRDPAPPSLLSEEDQVLKPLTPTDIGGFLAAAEVLMMGIPVNARVRDVLSALPTRCMMNKDLPRTPTPPYPCL